MSQGCPRTECHHQTGRGVEGLSPTGFTGTWPCHTVISDFWLPELRDEEFVMFYLGSVRTATDNVGSVHHPTPPTGDSSFPLQSSSHRTEDSPGIFPHGGERGKKLGWRLVVLGPLLRAVEGNPLSVP